MESGKATTQIQIPGNCLFPGIFKAFRMAIQPAKLIIALSAITIICLAGRIMDLNQTVVATSSYTQGTVTELQIYMLGANQLDGFIETHEGNEQATGVFSTLWSFAVEKFHGALNSLFAFDLPGVATNIGEYLKAVGWAIRYHTFYCIIMVVIELVVIAIAGGGICRIAALQFAQGERPGISEAVRFSAARFWSFFTIPLLPLSIIIVAGLLIFVFLALPGNIPVVGELIMGIFMPLALMAGALITVIVIGTAAGFNLMYPAIAYDGSDCFDAISRSFSYVYSRPWRMGFYSAVAVVYGAICYVFVRFFAFLLLLSTHTSLRFGVWVENSKEVNKLTAIWPQPVFTNLFGSSSPATAGWSQSVAAFLVYLLVLVVVGLVVSFILSFYFSVNTIIYSLLRNKVDDTAVEEVFRPLEDTQAESTTGEDESQQTKSEAESPPASETETKNG